MAESTSPRGSSGGEFAKKVQRKLSRSKEKVLQKLGKTVESRDDQFEDFLQQFTDQQIDGNRIYKDLKSYINSVRDMREASRRLSQSLFDAYESDWAGEEDLGAILEGEDLLWNDFEVKLTDQAVRTMETYVCQFPDVREKVAKRGRKLVDYDSSLHHLEALQAAKKRDDVKISKAEEERNAARSIYEGINSELKAELPVLYDSRIGCYVSVFSAVSHLQNTFYKEMATLTMDLQSVIKELQAQHPDKVFIVQELQRFGSMKRRSLMSPKAWKSSFSEFHKNYSPKSGQRFSFKSPEKPRHSGTLTRESSNLAISPRSPPFSSPTAEPRDLDVESMHSQSPSGIQNEVQSEVPSSAAQVDAVDEAKPAEGISEVEEEKKIVEEKEEVSEPTPPVESDDQKAEGERAPESESSSELNQSCDEESLDMQLSQADPGPLHIEEKEDSPLHTYAPRANGMENGEVSGPTSDLGVSQKDAPAEKQDAKTTEV